MFVWLYVCNTDAFILSGWSKCVTCVNILCLINIKRSGSREQKDWNDVFDLKRRKMSWIHTLFCWIRFSHLPAAIFILLDAAHPFISDSFDYIHYFFGVCVVLRCMYFHFILILQYGFAEIMHIPFHMHSIYQ